MKKNNTLRNLLHEPLLHFLIIGGLLFLIYGLQNDGLSNNDRRITISEADINRLTLILQKKMQRPPTQTELDRLIEQQIREEVMYREALIMGLDKNDTIVRRRLAQKVEFISADLATQVEPTDRELSDYLATHSDKFEIPGRINFVQIYFNTDRHGKQVETDALNLLSELKQKNSPVDISTLGDPFMMGQQHTQITEYETSRLFGKNFAKKLFSLPTGDWQGPVSSGYGLHLIRIDNKTPALLPALTTVREKVRVEWFAQQRRLIDKNFYQSLRQHYEIVIEEMPVENKPARHNLASIKS